MKEHETHSGSSFEDPRGHNQQELEKLSHFLELSEGFDFFVLEINSPQTLAAVLPRIRTLFPDRTVVEIDFSHTENSAITTAIYKKLEELRKQSEQIKYVFLLYGLEHPIGERGEVYKPLQVLNEQRDLIARETKAPLLLVLNKEQVRQFADKAADFWSVRTSVINFR